jgi:uncharacterized protein YpmB
MNNKELSIVLGVAFIVFGSLLYLTYLQIENENENENTGEDSNALNESVSYLENRYDVDIYTVEDFGYQIHGGNLTSWGTAVTDTGLYRFTYSSTGETSWIEVI